MGAQVTLSFYMSAEPAMEWPRCARTGHRSEMGNGKYVASIELPAAATGDLTNHRVQRPAIRSLAKK